MALVGPGAAKEQLTDVRPLLEGSTEYEYVTILNPLSDDFAVRVAQDIPINMPIEIRNKTAMHQTEADVNRTLGFPLKNPDFQGRKHIVNDTIIKAGTTLTLRGNEAQVAVRQLTNEILQREGKTRLSADPNLRNEVEQRIIISRGSMQDLMNRELQTPRTQVDNALARYNEVKDEPAFPELNNDATGRPTEASDGSGTDSPAQTRRTPGRPRKNQ